MNWNSSTHNPLFVVVNHFPEMRGTGRGSFGNVSSVLSWFAFAGVIITIIIQLKELELSYQEFERSVAAQNKSHRTLTEQLLNL